MGSKGWLGLAAAVLLAGVSAVLGYQVARWISSAPVIFASTAVRWH